MEHLWEELRGYFELDERAERLGVLLAAEVGAADHVQIRIRSSSSPAAAKAASRRSVTSRRIRYGSGFQRQDGTSYSGSPSIGFGSIAT